MLPASNLAPRHPTPRGSRREEALILSLALSLFFSPLFIQAAPPSEQTSDFQSFRTDILPILTKAGCNAGACHGAATGQGGFKLSLLGYDPEEDHDRITRELGGRRIDLNAPESSLLLQKASRQMEHEGGRRISRDSSEFAELARWIKSRAPYGRRDLSIASIRVSPADTLAVQPGHEFQLQVIAVLSDGSEEDVTSRARFTSNDDAIAQAAKNGLVTISGRGATSIMVAYGGQVAAARAALPFSDTEPALHSFAPRNFIDEHVLAGLKELRLPASPLCSDSEFLRRVCLDVAGRLPTLEEARAFADGRESNSRRMAILDQLLASDEFVDFWTMRLGDLLLAAGKRGNEDGARVYHDWIREQVRQNTPLDQMVRQLLTATGKFGENGPANYYTLATDPRDMAEHAGRMFLGSQIGCARCHAHPSDRWTQDDYYHFAAFFAPVARDGGTIKISPRASLEHPKTGAVMAPRALGASQPAAGQDGADPRLELARWTTAKDNPFFARSLANRVWKHLLGRGLVEPVDDLRPTNPPTRPALLDALAAELAGHHFDLRHLIRAIVSSRTYQLSSGAVPGNETDDRFYSRARPKPHSAQVFLDAICQVTGVPEKFENYAEGTRAAELMGANTPSHALDVLGRCSRERSCETPGSAGGGLAQALHLINGGAINGKLSGGTISDLFARNAADAEIVEELCLRAFARKPSPAERAAWEQHLAKSPEKHRAAQDLLWAMLNSREFALNY